MNDKMAILRILDANLNRIREALRVVEDVCRFAEDNPKASKAIKDLRHELAGAAGLLDARALLKSRDTGRDVGRELEGKNEYRREDPAHLRRVNLKRAQEAARVLEETGKVLSVAFARKIEKIRYRLYEIERETAFHRSFPLPCLYVILTRRLCRRPPEEVLRACLAGGANAIQLREKEAEDGEFLRWIEKARRIMEGSRARLIINDRIQLAVLAAADGVHLGQGDLPTQRAREILRPDQFIGRSTHCLSQARKAEAEGADYIGVGPLFPTKTKEHAKAVGIAYLREVEANTKIPYVAIGSVNRDTISDVLLLRPRGIAICTGIISRDDPEAETVFFRRALSKAWLDRNALSVRSRKKNKKY